MLKPSFLFVLLLCAAWQQHADAGELTLYGRQDFGGREVTLREATPELRAIGFNDRASSLIVRSGRWEVCEHTEFRGSCAIFERGEYRTLKRFNDIISSVREVGTGLDRRSWRRDSGPHGMIELFALGALGGNSTRLVGDVSDLVQIGFNNRAVSVLVEEGTWQLCSDSGYHGDCRILERGRYDDLGRELAGKVSSARLLPEGSLRVPPPIERSPRPLRPEGEVELFSSPDFSGVRVPVTRDSRTLRELDFNDRIGSIIVHAGRWEFCEHADYRGQCVIYGPGRYTHLGSMNNAISSLRRVQ
ncbi:MAG: beta/gamma crystallin-related protein [Pseudomonadota bacterium]